MGKGPKKGANRFKQQATLARTNTDVTVNYEYRDIVKLQELHQSNLKVGYMCIYQTFGMVTNDPFLEMGKVVNDTFMDNTGRLTKSSQGQRISADDSRAVPILAEKYGFTDPKTARGELFLKEALEYPEGTQLIVTLKDYDVTVKDYFPETTCVKGDAFFWDPKMASKEFHCIYGERKGFDIEWTDTQDHYPNGAEANHAVAWYSKKP